MFRKDNFILEVKQNNLLIGSLEKINHIGSLDKIILYKKFRKDNFILEVKQK